MTSVFCTSTQANDIVIEEVVRPFIVVHPFIVVCRAWCKWGYNSDGERKLPSWKWQQRRQAKGCFHWTPLTNFDSLAFLTRS
jgi:hypothetical protein